MKYWITCLFAVLFIMSCADDDVMEDVDFVDTPYVLDYGHFPSPDLPSDNPLRVEAVKLGKMLFFEKDLSKDGSQACADCHRQPDGFSDSLRLSIGVEGLPGKRQAMPVFNLAWHTNGFFWDGRAHLLRDQAILPIQDPLEMNETLDNVISKLSDKKEYRDQFQRAFEDGAINVDNMALALEQFMLSVVSKDSKYDRYLKGEVQLTESEERGRVLFETEYNPFFPEFSGADCAHCHGGINFENDQYMNNGLDDEASITDIGFEEVTKNRMDRAKFKVPSLRNVAVTAPYMHDGRFQTLEEVIDHYNEGIQESMTTDITVLNTKETGLFLDEQDKQDLINFMKTLTDPVFLTNQEYANPF
jgi:cytochrome c peroxidase